LWNALKRSGFPVFSFSGGAELAFGEPEDGSQRRKLQTTALLKTKSWRLGVS
jgi:hypothetical protein